MTKARRLLFGALLLGSAGFYHPVDYDNSKSRYLLLGALVDEGRLSIDSHQEYTIDKASSGGHYFSIKPMGLAMLSAPFYWVMRKTVLGPVTALPDPTILADHWAKYLTRVVVVSVPFALLGLLLFDFLIDFGIPARNAMWAVLAYSFGTIALNHAMVFSGHQTAAFFLFSSFVLIWRLQKRALREAQSTAIAFVAGACAALSVLCDFLTVVYAVMLTVYLLSGQGSRRMKGSFVVGGMIGAVALGLYNEACFGSLLSTGYSHLSYAPFQQYTSRGLFGIETPRLENLFGLLFSASRGLFFISPVLILALMGLTFLYRRTNLRREFLLLSAIPAVGVLLYSGYPGWHGGWGFGARYLVPVLPFLAVPLAFAADGGRWFQLAFWLSAFQVGCAQIGIPYAAPEIRNPIAEFVLPLMSEGGAALSLFGMGRPAMAWAGVAQFAVIVAACALALRALPRARRRRLPRLWRAALAAWCVCVALGLVFLRTPEQGEVHRFRALILGDDARALQSPELQHASESELLLSR